MFVLDHNKSSSLISWFVGGALALAILGFINVEPAAAHNGKDVYCGGACPAATLQDKAMAGIHTGPTDAVIFNAIHDSGHLSAPQNGTEYAPGDEVTFSFTFESSAPISPPQADFLVYYGAGDDSNATQSSIFNQGNKLTCLPQNRRGELCMDVNNHPVHLQNFLGTFTAQNLQYTACPCNPNHDGGRYSGNFTFEIPAGQSRLMLQVILPYRYFQDVYMEMPWYSSILAVQAGGVPPPSVKDVAITAVTTGCTNSGTEPSHPSAVKFMLQLPGGGEFVYGENSPYQYGNVTFYRDNQSFVWWTDYNPAYPSHYEPPNWVSWYGWGPWGLGSNVPVRPSFPNAAQGDLQLLPLNARDTWYGDTYNRYHYDNIALRSDTEYTYHAVVTTKGGGSPLTTNHFTVKTPNCDGTVETLQVSTLCALNPTTNTNQAANVLNWIWGVDNPETVANAAERYWNYGRTEIYRDGQLLETLVFDRQRNWDVSPPALTYTDWTAEPGKEYTYQIHEVLLDLWRGAEPNDPNKLRPAYDTTAPRFSFFMGSNAVRVMTTSQCTPATDRPPTGLLEKADCPAGKISGYAYDPDSKGVPIWINIYKRTPQNGVEYLGLALADKPRPDVATSETGDRIGFEFAVPASMKESNQIFSIAAYAVSSTLGGPSPLLDGTPKYLDCTAQPTEQVQVDLMVMDPRQPGVFVDGPLTVPMASTVQLKWEARHVAGQPRCRAEADWTGDRTESGLETLTNLTSPTYVFQLTCFGTNQSFHADSVTVNVTASSTVVVNLQAEDPANPGSYTDGPITVDPGATVRLIWTTEDVTSCSGFGSWSGDKPLQMVAPGETSPPINEATSFVLSCEGAHGSKWDEVRISLRGSGTTAGQVNVIGDIFSGGQIGGITIQDPSSVVAAAIDILDSVTGLDPTKKLKKYQPTDRESWGRIRHEMLENLDELRAEKARRWPGSATNTVILTGNINLNPTTGNPIDGNVGYDAGNPEGGVWLIDGAVEIQTPLTFWNTGTIIVTGSIKLTGLGSVTVKNGSFGLASYCSHLPIDSQEPCVTIGQGVTGTNGIALFAANGAIKFE